MSSDFHKGCLVLGASGLCGVKKPGGGGYTWNCPEDVTSPSFPEEGQLEESNETLVGKAETSSAAEAFEVCSLGNDSHQRIRSRGIKLAKL